jgi:hypothetical protein
MVQPAAGFAVRVLVLLNVPLLLVLLKCAMDSMQQDEPASAKRGALGCCGLWPPS